MEVGWRPWQLPLYRRSLYGTHPSRPPLSTLHPPPSCCLCTPSCCLCTPSCSFVWLCSALQTPLSILGAVIEMHANFEASQPSDVEAAGLRAQSERVVVDVVRALLQESGCPIWHGALTGCLFWHRALTGCPSKRPAPVAACCKPLFSATPLSLSVRGSQHAFLRAASFLIWVFPPPRPSRYGRRPS